MPHSEWGGRVPAYNMLAGCSRYAPTMRLTRFYLTFMAWKMSKTFCYGAGYSLASRTLPHGDRREQSSFQHEGEQAVVSNRRDNGFIQYSGACMDIGLVQKVPLRLRVP